MSRRAWLYVLVTISLGAGLFLHNWASFLTSELLPTHLWPVFFILTFVMAMMQMFRTEAATHEIYHPNLMFAFAGVLLLPQALFGLMVVISHALEWAKERLRGTQYLKAWYLQPFNVCMHILVGGITYFVYGALANLLKEQSGLGSLLVMLVSAGVYMFLNHVFVGAALVLARQTPWRESGILEIESLAIDFAMLAMGITAAVMMQENIWLILPAMAPLYLIFRALAVPNLKRQASTDPKTGLWNTEHFRKVLETELNRAHRFNRPLVVVMSDLDLLRNINNVYGHLTGDVVLTGVASILKQNLREFDTVARFGGEEFSILMPETTTEQAYPRIEAIRQQIEQTIFTAPLTNHKIRATMSFGITSLVPSDRSTIDLIHRADMAVYTAKIKGRNQTFLDDQTQTSNISLEERMRVQLP
jgi:diguanylate cyclase (GGDEF)-like protein